MGRDAVYLELDLLLFSGVSEFFVCVGRIFLFVCFSTD